MNLVRKMMQVSHDRVQLVSSALILFVVVMSAAICWAADRPLSDHVWTWVALLSLAVALLVLPESPRARRLRLPIAGLGLLSALLSLASVLL